MAPKKQPHQEKGFLSLPRLKAGHGLPTPATNEWTRAENALAFISRSIDVQNSGEKGHSIPDVFSQSVQFEFDLSIGNADAVGQWQGLLATLLLNGSGSLVRVRELIPEQMADSPFLRIFKAVAKRRGVRRVTLFELRRRDGEYSAVAFRVEGDADSQNRAPLEAPEGSAANGGYSDPEALRGTEASTEGRARQYRGAFGKNSYHMAAMLCPAADLGGPFAVDDPWIVRAEGGGYAFTAPFALLDDARYEDRRVALRNEIYALATRGVPVAENRDGLQMNRLKEFFAFLDRGGDGISGHPVNAEVRSILYTLDPENIAKSSPVFTDKLCLFREGDAYNRLNACAGDSMRVFSGGAPTDWRALLPIRESYAWPILDRLRAGTLHLLMQWKNGAVDVELQDEFDEVLDTHRYRIQDLINYTRHRNAPQVAVWPPKALNGWNRYYLLRYDDGNALPLTVRVVGAGDAKGDVTLLAKMPEGLSFFLEGEEMGLLLPAYETATNARAKEYNVGFDFGTTATTAYKHDPLSGVTTPVTFAGEGALFLFGREEGAGVALTAQFVAERIADRATCYSLLRRKDGTPDESGALLTAAIPFLTSAAFNTEIIRDVSDDLKWGTLAQDKLRAHLFLEQYLMMCLWHVSTRGAASVHWRASYPLAMQGRLQEEFIAKVQTIVSSLCTHCYRVTFDTAFCSESEAVGFMMMDNDIQARYLKGQTINDTTGFFCIDIGGGSTDFSFWLKRRPLMQASLRWAGNAILCDSVTRENHGAGNPPRANLTEFFFPEGASEGKRAALAEPLYEGKSDEFRRVWNVLVDEITDAIKGLHRANEPLLNYLNIVRVNLYLLFYFGGRMAREAILKGAKVGTRGTPLPVAVLGNGAKMMKLLYNDVEMVKRPRPDGTVELVAEELRNEARYADEIERFTRAFVAGCGIEGFEISLIEPFMPKQEAARGLAIAPEAFLLQKASRPDAAMDDWPMRSAYDLTETGVVAQTLTDEYRTLVMDSFAALRRVFGDDQELRAFLATLFDSPEGERKFSVDAYYDNVWAQCLRHNPEPMLPGQPLPQKDTIAGRYVEMLSAMNRMMKSV